MNYRSLQQTARLSASYFAVSDWIERHPSNYYKGSDWIERHPSSPTK
jgi:hypothetical protein